MYRIVNEIPLGNHHITIKENQEGDRVARLSSATHGGLIEIQKTKKGTLRLREMEIGSAEISTEHLAMLLNEIGADMDLVSEIQKFHKNNV